MWLLPILTLSFSKNEIYFSLWTLQPSYPGTPIPGHLSGTRSPRQLQIAEQAAYGNWFQGKLPISFNSRKSAHIYAWPLKWTAWLLLLICSQRSILSVGTPGGSHAGTGQGEKNHPVDILNGTENSTTISVSLFPAMPCIDFSSSFLGHFHTSKP